MWTISWYGTNKSTGAHSQRHGDANTKLSRPYATHKQSPFVYTKSVFYLWYGLLQARSGDLGVSPSELVFHQVSLVGALLSFRALLWIFNMWFAMTSQRKVKGFFPSPYGVLFRGNGSFCQRLRTFLSHERNADSQQLLPVQQNPGHINSYDDFK